MNMEAVAAPSLGTSLSAVPSELLDSGIEMDKPDFNPIHFEILNPSPATQREMFATEIKQDQERLSFDCANCMPQRCYCYCNCACNCFSPSVQNPFADIWN